ncbi:MAG TPA: RNA 2',3'-cyclic phosphodiesterase [Usitatibacteraceae bacterium]|nr:RNA 2',3'-cyclic phosphodiesterase [Usitatibacteraceae bacterium]
MARLFFALWPDAGSQAALADWAREIANRGGGRPVSAARLHITLVFLGEVDPARIAALCAAAEGVRSGAFTLGLDRIGAFRKTGVAWAGCRQPPAELLSLQAGLERRIAAAGFSPDIRPFAPHLTLARRVRDPAGPADVEAVSWRVKAFALVESARGGGGYRTLAEWPLEEGKT